MKLDTIINDVLDAVTGGQGTAQAITACALGAHEAGRQMESKRWFWQKPTAKAVIDNSLKGCAAGLEALGARSGRPL